MKRGICLALMTIGCFFLAGCPASGEDYQQLVDEKEALAAELAKAREENDILRRVLENVHRERETLLAVLAPEAVPVALDEGGSAASANAANAEPASRPGGQVHVVGEGDTLSKIATRYGVTLQELLRLNPFLNNRRELAVWKGDLIHLP